jgi:hypothetical protein
MPTRFGAAAILLFWLGSTSLVAYRELWPRFAAGGPPPIIIDLADEAGQFVPIRWVLYRNGQKIGSLTTEMKCIPADDTFRFTHIYREVTLDFAGLRVSIPELTETTRVTRTGELRSQSLNGRLTASLGLAKVNLVEFVAVARMQGWVVDGQLHSQVDIVSPGHGKFERTLEPVPMPSGRVLNPLQPVNRLGDVRPGLRWVVPEVNPLRDAAAALASEYGVPWAGKHEDLIAEVLANPQTLNHKGEDVSCWIIEYRTDKLKARTWVKTTDGKVLRQEAFDGDERISLERDE